MWVNQNHNWNSTSTGTQLLFLTDLSQLNYQKMVPYNIYPGVRNTTGSWFLVPHSLGTTLPDSSHAGIRYPGYRTFLVRPAPVPVSICLFCAGSGSILLVQHHFWFQCVRSTLVPVPVCVDLTYVIPEPST